MGRRRTIFTGADLDVETVVDDEPENPTPREEPPRSEEDAECARDPRGR